MVFENFTERSQKVLVEAQKESQYFRHGYIGTEHILLGILREGGYAKEVLYNNKITLDNVRRVIEDYLGFGDIDISIGEMLLNPQTKKILDDSLVKARAFNHQNVKPEHILLSLLDDKEGVAYYILGTLGLDFNLVKSKLKSYLYEDKSGEINLENKSKKKNSKLVMLSQYGINLTELAREGKLDPVIGREKENQRILEILCRRIKNNPCLIGEPGVGKTAVVEGLAQRIVNGNVPDILRDKEIISLDLTSMIAGAKYRGEFEERLKRVMEEIKMSQDIIIFIDEIHTIVGAGAAEGAIDASNILKPALARGEIKCIGATTIDEYRKYIEKDPALERRFQPVRIDEPSKEDTLLILKGIKEKYEMHHNVKIEDEALEAAVELADRYITDRYLPDKAIDLIDEASAKVRIENLNNFVDFESIENIKTEIKNIIREKENSIINQDFEKAAYLRDKEQELREKLNNYKVNSNNEISDNYLVNREKIAKVVSAWTKIPLEKLTEKESEKLLRLEETLQKRVVGQKEAILAVSRAIRRARVGLKDPNRPIGTFIFCGPTGVGKTELCNALAETMFGNKNNLIRIDMSEYMEKHSVSRLIGAPPGYVGYNEGGQLTEAVRRNPYSVILLDEIEKAHEDIYNILLQIMEDGRLTDNMGRNINFRNSIIIMTSNVGAHNIKKQSSVGFSISNDLEKDEYEKMKNNIMEEIKRKFKPEFLNRVDDIIVFHKLKENDILKIVNLLLNNTINKLKEREISLSLDEESKRFLVSKGVDTTYGARPLRRVITKELEDKLSEEMLKGFIKVGDNLKVYCSENGLKFKHIS
ncbi:ATP-dependent Clp protease ATP-binding subunit [Caproiciproducens sp. MSJ-32]|uniref:ATP-dependent Clp protease ATP-binding subunit n=1 Tax=Caproiciproducens sp. MSJ-32 TaxID=2841527 RepID=UPI001C114B69|nr:ATP-dependent Clp protease ATP-binding subunit [Caproiciproducens sp. MSJ-32]MBU5455679.1 ATP-dependent Clp protease ATP-binding subunit [Caproiciproducens sp. MSJ-32]